MADIIFLNSSIVSGFVTMQQAPIFKISSLALGDNAVVKTIIGK